MNKFHIYIQFPTEEELLKLIKTEEDGFKFLESIRYLIDRADCEKETDLYYESSNKNLCSEMLLILSELIGNFGVMSPVDALNSLLTEASAVDFEENPIHVLNENDCVYRLWDFDSRLLEDQFPKVLKEIAQKILNTEGHCLLLNINNAIPNTRNFFPIFKDCRDNPENVFPKFLHIYYVNNFEKLEAWIQANRIIRNYNYSDPRHDEGNPQYIHGKSPILGGQNGKERLAELLKTALTDKRAEIHASKDLMNYDDIRKEYVWFEAEESSNQFHGYHLVKPTTHERDSDAIDKIPQRVIDILEYRKIIYATDLINP